MKSLEINRSARVLALRSSLKRSVQGAASSTFVGMLLAIGSTAALAGTVHLDPSVTVAVPPDPTDNNSIWVSYSRSDQAVQAAYTVTIANPTTSNLNNAWFKISTLPDTTALPGVFVLPAGGVQTVPNGSCTADPSLASGSPITSLVCNLSGIVDGAPSVFTLIVQTPQYSTTDPTTTQLVLSWTLQAGQGNAQSNPSQVVNQLTAPVDLRKTTTAKARSLVNGNSPFNVLDNFALTQITPPITVTAGLGQNENPSSCGAQYKKCLQSAVTIVDLSGNTVDFTPATLVIDLIRNKSTLKPKADITTAVLFYAATANDTPLQIGPCAQDTSGNWIIPSTIPTVYAQNRCVIPATPTNAFTFVDSSGNWHFRVLGFTNGIINW